MAICNFTREQIRCLCTNLGEDEGIQRPVMGRHCCKGLGKFLNDGSPHQGSERIGSPTSPVIVDPAKTGFIFKHDAY